MHAASQKKIRTLHTPKSYTRNRLQNRPATPKLSIRTELFLRHNLSLHAPTPSLDFFYSNSGTPQTLQRHFRWNARRTPAALSPSSGKRDCDSMPAPTTTLSLFSKIYGTEIEGSSPPTPLW